MSIWYVGFFVMTFVGTTFSFCPSSFDDRSMIEFDTDDSGTVRGLTVRGQGHDLDAMITSRRKEAEHVEVAELKHNIITPSEIGALKLLPNLKSLHLGDYPDSVTLEENTLKRIGELSSLESVDLFIEGRARKEFSALGRLSHLQHFGIHLETFADTDAFDVIATLRNIESLDIRCNQELTELSWLDGLERLRVLSISAKSIHREIVRHLMKLRRLREVRIGGVSLSSDDVKRLASALGDHLEELQVSVVTDDAMSGFDRLHHLRRLVVVTDREMEPKLDLLKSCKELRNIHLIGFTAKAIDVELLERHTSLESFEITSLDSLESRFSWKRHSQL